MPQAKTAPYGSWKSPITSDLIVAQVTSLSDVRLAGDDIYWLEGRPQEQGRNVIVRAGRDGAVTDITPAGFNARTRVHEYGGASWLVAGGTCIFSNFSDQRLYRQLIGQSGPEPLTPAAVRPPFALQRWRARPRMAARKDFCLPGKRVRARCLRRGVLLEPMQRNIEAKAIFVEINRLGSAAILPVVAGSAATSMRLFRSARRMDVSLVLTCATEFGKSFEPIAPMVRVGGDTLQVTVAVGCFSGHGNSGTLDVDRARAAGSNGRGSAVLAPTLRKQRVGAMPKEKSPGRENGADPAR